MYRIVEYGTPSVLSNKDKCYLLDLFPRSIFHLGDSNITLAGLSRFFFCIEGKKTIGSAVYFTGFGFSLLAVVAETTVAAETLVKECGIFKPYLIVLSWKDPIPHFLSGNKPDVDYWMTKDTASKEIIRYECTSCESEELKEFYKEVGMKFWSPAMFRFGHVFCIRDSYGRIVSAACVNFIIQEKSYAQIGSLATRRDMRGKGMGSSVLKAVISSLNMVGIKKCGIFAESSDTELIKFYKKLGFIKRGSFNFFKIEV